MKKVIALLLFSNHKKDIYLAGQCTRAYRVANPEDSNIAYYLNYKDDMYLITIPDNSKDEEDIEPLDWLLRTKDGDYIACCDFCKFYRFAEMPIMPVEAQPISYEEGIDYLVEADKCLNIYNKIEDDNELYRWSWTIRSGDSDDSLDSPNSDLIKEEIAKFINEEIDEICFEKEDRVCLSYWKWWTDNSDAFLVDDYEGVHKIVRRRDIGDIVAIHEDGIRPLINSYKPIEELTSMSTPYTFDGNID